MLKVESVNQFYGQSHILWELSLEIKEGSCVALIGRNGVGKTTLVRCVMGQLPVTSGSISWNGVALLPARAERRASLGIGYVPQGRMIFPLMTVEENLRTGLGALPRAARKMPDLVFELFPVLHDMLGRRGGDLSGGQQQQLAIARALVPGPRFLILDEPTEGIQPNVVQQIGDVIVKLNKDFGLTVLVIEQKLPFVRRVADEFFIMTKGSIVAEGDMNKLSEALIQEHLSV